MPRNLFRGFKVWEADEPEKEEDPESMVNVVKKALKVPKKIWLGMPVLVSNTKIGKKTITEPTVFYVYEFDDNTVTLRNVPSMVGDDDDIEDEDGDYDTDEDDIHGRMEFMIDRKDFYDLQKPQGMQPGGGMEGGMGGGLGGI